MKGSAAGAWDLHIHAAPCLFERRGDAWDTAKICRKAGMAAMVLKAHHGSTVELAAILDSRFPGIRIFGGLTLNYSAGGLNPHAVDAALRLGARIVWLPTIHAAFHGKRIGVLGGFKFQPSRTALRPAKGIRITGSRGRLTKPLQEILSLLHGQRAVLATGHLSPEEIYELRSWIQRERLRIRLLLNHVFFKVPDLSVRQLRELRAPWIWFEVAFATVSPLIRYRKVEEVASKVSSLAGANWILSSDSGQKGNPPAPKALALFAEGLVKGGLPEGEVDKMMRERPRVLIGCC